MLAVRCPCGLEVTGEGDEALVAAVQAHLADRHPRLVGAYDADDILSLAYRRPGTAAS
ncbi:DUF1059 domain-containing protein [Trujillonella endophytica]|uniref:DUF1059 domain-containing protein n=1 Tax=Trujillonella endophytica TaxID=673521 RepID=A0A1H8SWN5_9ACTN|nr:DUF1059 domain-containing protein [Trujillella endophytica]SEO82603.1 hypothetical protein SAMN05660991_01865 [Trujillella endophytica]